MAIKHDLSRVTRSGPNGEIVIVTLLCDSGQRHLTKFWNDERLVELGILQPSDLDETFLSENVDTLKFLS
jgi:hypothetical protein